MSNQKSSTQSLKGFTRTRETINKFIPNRRIKFGIAAVVLLLLLTFSILVVASYTSFDLPLVSKGVQRKVDYLIASVPAIPKTSKQILTKAFEDSRNIKTAKETFIFSLQSDNQELASMTIEARLDTSDMNNVALEAEIIGKLAQADQEAIVDLDLVEKSSDLFFKINKAPMLPGYDLDSLLGKWYRIDLEKVGEEIGAKILEDQDIKSDVEAKIEEVFDTLDETGIFKKIKKLPDEKIAGKDSYHLSYAAEISDAALIFQELVPEPDINRGEIEGVLEETKIDLWVDKKTFFVNKVEVHLKLKEGTEGAIMQLVPINKQLGIRFSYTLSEINKPIKIESPKNAQGLSSLIELLMIIQPSSSNLLLQEQLLGTSTQTREFGGSVLFYERFLRVLTLFPNTI